MKFMTGVPHTHRRRNADKTVRDCQENVRQSARNGESISIKCDSGRKPFGVVTGGLTLLVKRPFRNSPCGPANGGFLRIGAHVLDVRSAPMLENRHFRLGLTNFEMASKAK
jgi:hypothetical protein